jgi:MoaF C-terminal domain
VIQPSPISQGAPADRGCQAEKIEVKVEAADGEKGGIMSFVGRRILIKYESGLHVEAHYTNSTQVFWKAITGPEAGTTGTETIYALEVAPKVFFISWLEKSGVSVSQILDLERITAAAFVTFDTEAGRQCHFDRGTFIEIAS